MASADIGVIGGSGLYRMDGLTDVEHVAVETPFGAPSAVVTVGTLDDARVAFIPRHGRHHQFGPSHVPVRANLWALKALGVRRVISASAVGSLREQIHPLDFVVPDQLFDRTSGGRPRTFFEDGPVVHVALDEPFCPEIRATLLASAPDAAVTMHEGGTYICIEGPQFSTKAESRVFRSWGMDIIGMTAMPEARLAREAGLCYALLAMVTDYDVWHETEEAVSVATVTENLRRNASAAQAIVRSVVPALVSAPRCDCADALRFAVVTQAEGISDETRRRYSLLLERSPEAQG